MTTIKTIRLRKNPAASPSVTLPDSQGMADAAGSPPGDESGVGAPPPGLEPVGAATGPSGKSFALFAVFGLISTLAVLTMIVLQYIEMAFYKADPSVWPS